MVDARYVLCRRTAGFLVSAALLASTGLAFATDQSQQRQQGRNANQAAKQDGRQEKRDIKY